MVYRNTGVLVYRCTVVPVSLRARSRAHLRMCVHRLVRIVRAPRLRIIVDVERFKGSGPSWAILGPSWAILGQLRPSCGLHLELPWNHVWAMFKSSLTSTKKGPHTKHRKAREQISKRRGGESSLMSNKFKLLGAPKWRIPVDVEQNRTSSTAQVAWIPCSGGLSGVHSAP